MEVSQAWGPSFSYFADLVLSGSFSFFHCLRIAFIFFMNRNTLICESSVRVQCLLSKSCFFSSPGVPFLVLSEFCCWASGGLKCCEKDKVLMATVFSPTVNNLLHFYLAGQRLQVIPVTSSKQIDLPYASHIPRCTVNDMNLSVSHSSSGAPLV